MITVLIILGLYFIPLIILLLIGWILLPKNSTISNLSSLYIQYSWYPPIPLVLIPGFNLATFIIVIFLFIFYKIEDYFDKSNIKIK